MIEGLLGNQIVAGGLALGAAGGVLASLRKVPQYVIEAVKRQIMLSVEIKSTDLLYYWVREWMDQQPYSKTARAISACVDYKRSDRSEPTILVSPAPGDHFISYKGRRIWMSRDQRENKAWGAIDETITLKMLGRDQRLIRELLSEVEATVKSDTDRRVSVWMGIGDGWEELTKKTPRDIATVILPGDDAQTLVDDITRFYNERDWYAECGLPYRRGYLFYGPPGSGKSSLAQAVAGALRKDLYVLNLAGKDMDDHRLSAQMMRVPPKGIILIEDVDAAFTDRDKSDDHASHVTFSGLLNALDGVGAKDGQVVVMSTNHIERLDPALIRPGRVDFRLLLDNACTEQIERLFLRFFPEAKVKAIAFAAIVGDRKVSMASLQSHLVTYRHDAVAAIENYS